MSYGGVAATVLSVPLLLCLFVESPLLLVARYVGRRRMAVAAFAAMAGAALAAAFSTNAGQLAFCLSIAVAAGGVALSLVEVALMDAAPEHRELWMTRFTIGGSLGDLAAPGLVAAVALLGFGWRGAFAAVAVITALTAWLVGRHISDGQALSTEPRPSIREALRRAFGNRRLIAWSLGVIVCDLLDEILVVVAILFLREIHGLDVVGAALALAVLPAGAAAGLLLTERVLGGIQPKRWLALNCVGCAAALGGVIVAPSAAGAIALLGAVGFTAASMWPIATAQAYRALPEDALVVAAVERLFAPLGAVFPIAIAVAADLAGLGVALALLALQPLTLLALALRR